MGKYLMLWELNLDKIPDDPKARGEGWIALLDMVKQDLNSGMHIDWGTFVGEMKGYAISVGDEVELAKRMQQFFPFVTFTTHPVISVDQVAELAKSLTG